MVHIEKSELKKVERLLGDIKENTETPWWKVFASGLLYGAGIVVGTLAAATFIGWILSLFGVIPGFDLLAARLQGVFHSRY